MEMTSQKPEKAFSKVLGLGRIFGIGHDYGRNQKHNEKREKRLYQLYQRRGCEDLFFGYRAMVNNAPV
jgi:hypothetical protein